MALFFPALPRLQPQPALDEAQQPQVVVAELAEVQEPEVTAAGVEPAPQDNHRQAEAEARQVAVLVVVMQDVVRLRHRRPRRRLNHRLTCG